MHLERGGRPSPVQRQQQNLPASCNCADYATWGGACRSLPEQDRGSALKAGTWHCLSYSQPAAVRQAQVWVYYCPARRYPRRSASAAICRRRWWQAPRCRGDYG